MSLQLVPALREPTLTLDEALAGARKIAELLGGRMIEGAGKGNPSSKLALLKAVEVHQDSDGGAWWLFVVIATSRGKSLLTQDEVEQWLRENASGQVAHRAEW